MIISNSFEINAGYQITGETFIAIARDLVDLNAQIYGRMPELKLNLSRQLPSGGLMIRGISEISLCKRWSEINGEKILDAGARIEHPRDQNSFILKFDPAAPTRLSFRFGIPYPTAVATQISSQLKQLIECGIK